MMKKLRWCHGSLQPRSGVNIRVTTTMTCPGLNVKAKWASLLLNGRKTIEARTYNLFHSLRDRPVWIIETPDTQRKTKAKITGFIEFGNAQEYSSYTAFRNDAHQHLIAANTHFDWKNQKKCMRGQFVCANESRTHSKDLPRKVTQYLNWLHGVLHIFTNNTTNEATFHSMQTGMTIHCLHHLSLAPYLCTKIFSHEPCTHCSMSHCICDIRMRGHL